MASVALLEAVAVTAELCGRAFTPAAAAVFVSDLSAYPEAAVLKALTKCRREVRGVLTTQDVVSRIDDGRPGPEEAWAMVPLQEWQSVVWTSEMAEAFGVCHKLLASDKVAARMAFKEAYTRLVGQARDAGRATSWVPSLGHDQEARQRVLHDAVATGRLTLEVAQAECPALPAPAALQADTSAAERVRIECQAITARKKADADGRGWARDLRTLERGGLPLTETQRLAWRNALDGHHERAALPGEFKGIPASALPPGMRSVHHEEMQ